VSTWIGKAFSLPSFARAATIGAGTPSEANETAGASVESVAEPVVGSVVSDMRAFQGQVSSRAEAAGRAGRSR